MGRRKALLVIIIFGLMVLFVSPLTTSTPVPDDSPAAVPEEPADPAAASPSPSPLPPAQPAELKVAAVTDEPGLALLQRQGEQVAALHPEIRVDWRRVDPSEASAAALQQLMEDTDIVLLPNEDVKALAVSGSLLPVDSAFVGESLSEQFGALLSQVKWNVYLWGVPRDLDPYVLVWNRNVAAAVRGSNGAAAPSSLSQWLEWPQKLAEQGVNASWLALDPQDPYALIAWVGAATGRRQDEWFEPSEGGAAAAWTGQPYEQALTLLSQQRAGVAAVKPDTADFWSAFAAGRYGAAVVRNSAATQGLAALPSSAAASLRIDRSLWETPFVWPNGDSFALSAWTPNEEAAVTWIGEMTGRRLQTENEEATGRLPVYRSLYDGEDGDRPALASAESERFPNQPPLSVAPDLPEKLSKLGAMLGEWLGGTPSFAEWKERWAASLAESQADD